MYGLVTIPLTCMEVKYNLITYLLLLLSFPVYYNEVYKSF